MKKVFSISVAIAIFMMVTISTSCNSYTGKYYNVDYVDGITESEYSEYSKQPNAREMLVVLFTWFRDKSSHEKKEHLKDFELTAYLKSKNISDASINDIMNTLAGISTGGGCMESFSYKNNETTYHMHFFFEVVE